VNKSHTSTHNDQINEKRLQTFRSLFVSRKDAYAQWRGDQPMAIREALGDDQLAAHLAGKYRVGTYLVQLDGRTPFLVFDVDVQRKSLVRRILRRLRNREVTAYVERSKSKGFHIWIFFDEPLPAAEARKFATLVLNGMDPSKIEIFPKQDEVKDRGLGNCIWLMPMDRSCFTWVLVLIALPNASRLLMKKAFTG
jgi:hypothetical protein